MRIFSFEKWFFDVLTPERDYIIIFHTLLKIFGFNVCFLEVNISRFIEGDNFHLNQKLKVLKRSGNTITTRQGHILFEEGMGKIMLLLRGIEIDISISPVHPSEHNGRGMKIQNRGGGYLEWKPLYLKAMVTGRFRITGENGQVMEEEALTGIGYIDYLSSTMSPFRVPVRQLYWGRLHSQDLDLTFSYALGEDRDVPGVQHEVSGAQMMVHTGGEIIYFDKISVHPDKWEKYAPPGISCPVSYRVEATSQRMQLSLEVIHLKPAIVSEFMKNPKELGRFRMEILRKISRNPRGIKFYSFATLEYKFDGRIHRLDKVFMIDEYVCFI